MRGLFLLARPDPNFGASIVTADDRFPPESFSQTEIGKQVAWSVPLADEDSLGIEAIRLSGLD